MFIDYFDKWETVQRGDWGWFNSGQKNCPYCNIVLENITGPWNDKEKIELYNKEINFVSEEQKENTDKILRLGLEQSGYVPKRPIEKTQWQRFDSLYELSINVCKHCNWWQVYRLHCNDFSPKEYSQCWLTQAIIKSTPIGSDQIPTEELASYLATHEDMINHIHHKKMEQLVGEVFRKSYDCEVIYCGQSHDRGIDLLLLKGEKTIPIQVKKRTKREPSERVSVVRDLLGVLLRDQYRDGIIVTTSQSFSSEARKDVRLVLNNGSVDSFELIDCQKFLDILKSSFGPKTESFKEAIPSILLGSHHSADEFP